MNYRYNSLQVETLCDVFLGSSGNGTHSRHLQLIKMNRVNDRALQLGFNVKLTAAATKLFVLPKGVTLKISSSLFRLQLVHRPFHLERIPGYRRVRGQAFARARGAVRMLRQRHKAAETYGWTQQRVLQRDPPDVNNNSA